VSMFTEKPKVPFAKQAAKVSLYVPFIAIGVNLLTKSIQQSSKLSAFAISSVCSVLIIIGFIFGIIALLGMKKHGKKGILWRSIIGLSVNSFLIISAILLFNSMAKMKEKMKTPKYSLSMPKAFIEYTDIVQKPNIIKTYIKGDPNDNPPDIMCLVEDLGGTISKEDIIDIKGRNDISLIKKKWNGYIIDVFRIEEKLQNIDTLTFNAQIPLYPRAIQITLVGLKSKEKELLKDLDSIILGIDGQSNWQ